MSEFNALHRIASQSLRAQQRPTPLNSKICWYFSANDLPVLKSAAERHLRSVSPTLRLELLARWCGFKTFAAMQAALRAAGGVDIRLDLKPESAAEFAEPRAVPMSRETLYLILASAAFAKVIKATPQLYLSGYGLDNLMPQQSQRREILLGVPREEHSSALEAFYREKVDQVRSEALKIGGGAGFLRALAFVGAVHSIKSENRKRGSYGMKHIAERISYKIDDEVILGREYVANGEMIAAAIYAGFRLFPGKSTQNTGFNMSERSLRYLESLQ